MKRSLRSWLWRVPVREEVDEEIAFHVEMRTRELVDKGLDAKAAREVVLARIGDTGRLRRTCVDLGRKRDREMRLTQWLADLRDDVAVAVRQLKASPAFTTVAVLTLALGIGANSAMFAVADATLLRPLPYPGGDRVVAVSELRRDGTRGPANPLDFVDWRERNRAFEAMAGVMSGETSITGADGFVQSVLTQAVTTDFFDVLGILPIAGRTFQPGDETPMSNVVVISEGLWQSHLGGDPAAVGGPIRLGGRTLTVAGVMPASFQFDIPGLPGLGPSQVWTILNPPRSRAPEQRYPHYLPVIARLKPGVTIDAARQEMAAISDAIAEESPATNKGHRATVDSLRDRLASRELRLTSLLLFGVVMFVLLMCCANVANLLLARTSERSRELAVRSALGAGRQRIVRQLLTESLVLAALGGMLGMAIGMAILKAAPSLVPPGLLPVSVPLAFDQRVLLFSVATAFAVAILYGLAPAWQATGTSLANVMSLNSRTAAGGSSRLRRGLAMAEVAVAVLLLCGAGLLLRTLLTLQDVDAGNRAGELLTTQVRPGPGRTPDALRQLYANIGSAVRHAPGVRDVAWGSALPFAGQFFGQAIQVDGDPLLPPANRPGATYQIVGPDYFRLVGVPVLEGRVFTDADATNAPQVAVVDEEFVRRYLKGRTPIGSRVSVNAMTQSQAVLREIVGVVKHIKERPAEPEAQPQLYVPLAQDTWWVVSLVVQPAGGRADAIAPSVRRAVASVEPNLSVVFRTLTTIHTQAVSRQRFRAVLVGAFALLALTLALVGVFGVLAYSVQQRTREFGVRIALGASAVSVLRLVMSSAVVVIGVGVGIGLVAAAVLSRSISTFLFGVRPLDPLTYLAVALVLIVTAAIAAAAPAWRAARVDPVVAFRNE
ncbi:MAG TPA: ABC transporter permease [Vicinamibacterales bacterium]|nr:ABC transporter permease [Vicinamibacterales bacterium]